MKQNRKLPVSECGAIVARRMAWAAVAAYCALCAAPAMAAQTAKPSAGVAQTHASAPAQTAPVSLATQPPAAATVTFRKGLLTVDAHNSTLLQILQAITAQTGMKVDGSPGDHRVFGVYGPDKPNTVITELLSGFGLNYLVVGTAKNGAPQKLVIAGLSDATPEPTQPVNSIQPAPQETLPQPQFGQRPEYQPSRIYIPRRVPAARPQPTNEPQKVRTPQEILKELEAMHSHGSQS